MSLVVGPFTDPNHIENKSLSDNCSQSIGDMSDKLGGNELLTEEEVVTNEKLVIEEELVIKEKLEMEEKIETEDLEDLE